VIPVEMGPKFSAGDTARGHPDIFHPPAHRDEVEVEAGAREAPLLAVERQTFPVSSPAQVG
jgi:hypothetical protein